MSDLSTKDSDKQSINEGFIDNTLNKIDAHLVTTNAKGILRRYFAINAFDGAMTSLGITIGSYIAAVEDPKDVTNVILLSAIAMAISGFTGTYMVESAERKRKINEIEEQRPSDAMAYRKSARFVSIFAAFVDGSAPFIASIPCLIPFALSSMGMIEIHMTFYTAIGAALFTLFIIGAFLGRLSESNFVFSGFKMVVAGALVAFLALLLGQQ